MRILPFAFALAAAGGCATESADLGAASQSLGECGLGDEQLATRVYTTADIPSLTPLQKAQFVAAFRESAWNDITTVEEAFLHADDHELRASITRDSGTNQYYVDVDYWVGDNPYGAVLYWGTDVIGAAVHDGFPEECGPLTYDYDALDYAPACGGFLTYVNTASFAALDVYLPSNVAQAIVDARTVAPFDSIASVVAVPGVAESRLQQLLAAARAADLVGASCSGIYDQLAISTDQAAALVAFVNQTSKDELDGTLAFLINHTVINTLLGTRPYATALAISNTAGVGPVVFRALRDAAVHFQPWEELVAAIDAIDHPDGQIRVDLHFDWVTLLAGVDAEHSAITCFGIPTANLPPGTTVRGTLANSNELMEAVGEAVALANRFGELTVDPTPGEVDVETRATGASFKGCYVSTHPDPWTYDQQAFFVNTANGASVLITQHYVE